MTHRHDVLTDLLGEVNRGILEYLRAVFQERSLSFGTMIVVRELREEPGITVSELSRRIGSAKSHISKLVEDLVRRGWAEKQPDPTDQRLVRLYLTKDVAEAWTEVRTAIRERLLDLTSGLPDRQVDGLIDGLEGLKAALDSRKGKGDMRHGA